MNKPLWKQFAEMTPKECDAEQASEFQRLERGDMSATELKEQGRRMGSTRNKESR